jgi:hypothetical protein
MIVCVKCGREMKCEENGLGVRYGESHVYTGDKYKCPECNIEVIKTGTTVHDPDHKFKTIEGKE